MPRIRALVFAAVVVDAAATIGACSSFGDTPPGDSPNDGSTDTSTDASQDTRAPTNDAGDASLAQAYRAMILADGPVAYWRMGRVESVVVVPDETGGGSDLLLSGSPDFQTNAAGIFGDDGAIAFRGKGGHAVASSSAALAFNGGAPFTLECWARRELDAAGDAGEYYQHVLSYVDGFTMPAPSMQNGYILYLRKEDPAATFAAHGAVDGGAVERGGKLVPPGTWAHYAMVFDGTSIALFIDAEPQGSIAVKGVVTSRPGQFTVAKAANETGRYFSGSLDEVAIYAKALDALTIARHFGAGRAQ